MRLKRKKAHPKNRYAMFLKIRSLTHIFAPIKVAALESVDKCLRSSDICRHRNIMYIAQTQNVNVVRLMRFRVHRIAEEYQQVYLVAGDTGRKLLIAALRAAQKSLDMQTCGLGNKLACCSCSTDVMSAQNAAVRDTKLNHKLLF